LKARSVQQSAIGERLGPVASHQHKRHALLPQDLCNWCHPLALEVYIEDRNIRPLAAYGAERPLDGRRRGEGYAAQLLDQTLQFHGREQLVLNDENSEAVQTSGLAGHVVALREDGMSLLASNPHAFQARWLETVPSR
jgi:hypothetical protein